MRYLPPLNALRAFEAAARHCSFSKAAKDLYVTPGAISQQIRQLEDWLETPLFVREPRRLRLTTAGRLYLTRIGAALTDVAKATQAVVDLRHDTSITVSVMASFATKWLVPRLCDFFAQHPDVDIRISCSAGLVDPDVEDAGERLIDFSKRPADLTIRYGRGEWPGLSAQLLMKDTVYPVCAPSLPEALGGLRHPSDLAGARLLHDLMPEHWSDWLLAAGVADIPGNRGPTFSHSHDMVAVACGGGGVALGRDALVAGDIRADRLVRPFELSIPAVFAYYLVWPPELEDHPNVVTFRNWLLHEVSVSQRPDSPSSQPFR